ncbi:MAG: extracellular solute-binding protein [Anaerolineaceae bacterium]|nr:MAG: extracellular solute-binding protein [Anaerolineaceae bacterium]
MKKVVKVLTLVVTLAFALTLVACSNGPDNSTDTNTNAGNKTSSDSTDKTPAKSEGSDETAEISFWFNYNAATAEAEAFEQVLTEFQDAYPHIKLNIEPVPAAGDGLMTRVTTALVANDLPDAFQYWGGQALVEMAEGGLLMDVQEYLDVTTKIKKEDFGQAAWDHYSHDGVIRGFATHTAFPSWFANKAIFDEYGLEIPKTMQDLINIAPTLRENGIIPLAMGSNGSNPAHFFLSELMHQYDGGTEEIRTLGQTNQFDTENLRKTAQMIIDLKDANVFPEDTIASGDWGPSWELYNSGKAAIIFTYPWMYTNMSDEIYANSVIIDAPVVDGGTVDPSSFVGSFINFGFLVTQKAWEEKQDAMVEFIDWQLSDRATQIYVDGGGMTPKNMSVDMSNKVYADVLDHIQGREYVGSHFTSTLDQDAWLGFQPACDELFAGALTAEQFAQKVQGFYDQAK